MKSTLKLIYVVAFVAALALGSVGCQKLFGGEFKSISEQDLTMLTDSAGEMQKRQLAQNEQARRELIKNLKQLYSLAEAAQSEGLAKTEKYQQQLAQITDLVLADAEMKQASGGDQGKPPQEIPKNELDAYAAAHGKDFDALVKLMNPDNKQPIPDEQLAAMKSQWAEVKIRAERARKAKLDKDPKLQLQLKLERAKLLAQSYVQSVQEKAKPTPADLKKYYETHPEADPEKIKKNAEEVYARVQKGEDFAALAKQYSADQRTSEKGGEEEWFVPNGTWIPEVEKALVSLKPGQIGELVKSPRGYHIFKLEERRVKKPEAPKPTEKGAPTPPPTPTPEAAKGPVEEVKIRHIYLSTREAESAEGEMTQKKVQRAIEDATLKYPIKAPEDFKVNVAGLRADPPHQGLQLPAPGSGNGERMKPMNKIGQ